MTAPTDPTAGTRYYRSFASYEVPFRPDEPIEFAGTEGLRSYYVAERHKAGRVVRFEKWRVVRSSKEPQSVALVAAEKPGSLVYFEAVANTNDAAPTAGKRLDYRETELLQTFFVGEVDVSGRACRAYLVRKEIAFAEEYEYWPDGRLRKRTMTGPGQTPKVETYDPQGQPLPDLAPDAPPSPASR